MTTLCATWTRLSIFVPCADDGGAERAAVNGGVGADLDIVVDDHIADLKHFAMPALVEHVAVTVRADDRAGVDGDAMADLASSDK